jgi:hypothetical protein
MFDSISWSEIVIGGVVVLFGWVIAIDAVIKFIG